MQALSLKGWKGDQADPRYLAIVEAVRERITGEHVAHHPALRTEPRISRRALVAGGVGISAIAVAGTGGWLLLKPGAADVKRIAVLPFANLSGDQEQSYFSDGIAEELRSALSRIGMEVIGRSSSVAVKDLDTKAAASKLGVANILTGSVRRSAEVIRVNAQLVSGKDGVARWAQSYDRAPGDAIKIQTDIAANVAQALSIALGQVGRAALTLGGTGDSVAQDLVLQARKLRRGTNDAGSLRKSVELSATAIARDPDYANAYVENASSSASLAANFASSPSDLASRLAIANVAANRALAIAPRLGSAHGVLAFIDQSLLKFGSALDHLKRALALSPDDPDVLAFATTTLPYIGDGQEALRLADHFIALDPLNSQAYHRKAEVLHVLRQYAQSVEAGRRASELAPGSSRLWTTYSLLLMNRLPEAHAEIAKIERDNPFRSAGEGLAAARIGDRAGAERILGQAKQQFGATMSYQYAQIHAQLAQNDQAFAELDNALAAKDPGLTYLKMDPFMDPIRDDPRFAGLVRKLNFP